MVNVDYVIEMMEQKHYTIGQLSVRSGVSKAQLSRMLRYKRGIGNKSLEGILRAFPEADYQKLIFLPSALPKGNG